MTQASTASDAPAPGTGSDRDLRRHAPVAAALGAIVLVALAVRATLISGTNEDVEVFQEWLDALRVGGGLGGLGDDISTYPPLWSYLVLASDALFGGARDVFVLKAPAIAADVVGAGYAYAIVRRARPTGWAPTFAFAAVLLAPTVVVNSAYWGQIDMLWVAPVVACVYYVLRDRPLAAFVALGIGLAIKQQALFLVPFLVVLALRRQLAWRWFAIPVVVYVVSILPAWAAGRSLRDLLLVYRDQAGQFEQLTLHASSVYAFVPERFSVDLGRPRSRCATSPRWR
jgi:Gpi18-like mannosyltransferase